MEDGTSFHLLPFLFILVLVFLNGFFVAAEFSVVKMRITRVEQLIKEGNKKANYIKKILEDLNSHLAAAQLGITLTSLGIGAVAEPAIAKILSSWFQNMIPISILHTVSFFFAFLIATTLHITIGEQVPKMWAIERAEHISLYTAKPLYWFYKLVQLPIWIFSKITKLVLKIIGVKETSGKETHTAEEIKMILSQSPDLSPEEQKMMSKIFDFNDRFIREVMVHRKEMDCVFLTDPMEESIEKMKKSKHSRFPVCGEDRDDIKGYINLKDLYKQNEQISLEEAMREIPKFYETTSIKKVLKHLQKNHHQIGIVVDEYGGVMGMITVEDIVEEIVGDIQDEFDDETEDFRKTKTGTLVEASVLIDDVENEFGIKIEEIDGIDTIGGYVLSKIEHPPEKGKKILIEDYEVTVVKTEEHRILTLLFKKIEENQKEA